MENQHQPSSILLIDHPTRNPPATRLRSITNLNKNMVQTTIDTTIVPNFHKYSLQNSSNNFLCFAKPGTTTNFNEVSAPCLLDIANNKLITLPNPCDFPVANVFGHYTSFYGVGYDSQIQNFKVLRICVMLVDDKKVHNFVAMAQVHTLGGGESGWKTAKGFYRPTGSILGKAITIDNALVFADFPQTDVTSSSQRYANVFHIHTEEFSKVSLPRGLRIGHLVGINGQLCAVDLSSDSSIRILVLPDLKGKWESLCTIKMKVTEGEKDHRRTRVIGGLKNGKLLFKSYEAYFVYDRATDELEYLQLPVETGAVTEVHCYNAMAEEEEETDDGGWVEVEYFDCVESAEGLN